MKEKEKEARNLKIQKWMDEGLSQASIAGKLHITRQRVQQIESSLGLSRERIYIKNSFNIKCGTCKNKFTTNKKDRKYCSRECFCKSRVKHRTKTEQITFDLEKKEKNKIKAKNYYHNIFKKKKDWKSIVQERNKKQYASQSSNKA